jgi:hypothetical protein
MVPENYNGNADSSTSVLAMFTPTHARLSDVISKFLISFLWNVSNSLKQLLNEIESRLAIELRKSSGTD